MLQYFLKFFKNNKVKKAKIKYRFDYLDKKSYEKPTKI